MDPPRTPPGDTEFDDGLDEPDPTEDEMAASIARVAADLARIDPELAGIFGAVAVDSETDDDEEP